MLLTNQKTINYEIYIKIEGNHSFSFCGCKGIYKLHYCNEKVHFNNKLAKLHSLGRQILNYLQVFNLFIMYLSFLVLFQLTQKVL